MYEGKVDVDMLNAALYGVWHIHISLTLIHCGVYVDVLFPHIPIITYYILIVAACMCCL